MATNIPLTGKFRVTCEFKRKGNWEKPICFLGRHTLIIYIAHEVIFTIIFVLLDLIF